MRALLVIFASALLAIAAFAQDVSEAELNTRTEAISKTLRCVVCQNQTVNDSPTPLAEDMKKLVRARVIAGDTDAEVREYMRERYGDYVLMTPPFQMNTLFLWLGPFLLIAGLGIWFVIWVRGRDDALAKRDVSADEKARVQAALYGDQPEKDVGV